MSGGDLLTSTFWYVTVEHQPVKKCFSYKNKTIISSIYSYLPHLQSTAIFYQRKISSYATS